MQLSVKLKQDFNLSIDKKNLERIRYLLTQIIIIHKVVANFRNDKMPIIPCGIVTNIA